MKVYIRAATFADVKAKLDKKYADIKKKQDWIQKKEAAIQKKLALLSKDLSNEDYTKLENYLNYLKEHDNWRVPTEIQVDTWGMVRKYGWDYNTPQGKALYSIADDAESIYNSYKAIAEMETQVEKYNEQIAKLQAKGEELDRIPDCLKEFMNDIIEQWDEYDLRIRHDGKDYYYQLSDDADNILYGGGSRSWDREKEKLAELYPDITQSKYSYRDERRAKFDEDHIIRPFEREYGSLKYARSIWYLSDEEIHKNNQKDGENLILDLLKRVTKITGAVTDWSGLYVTSGNMGAVLNGKVIGEEGSARVESITAGGYNIQRLHIRTLVKPIK